MKLESKAAIQIQKPIEDVFEAIVNPEKMTQYFISESSGKLESGNEVIWKFPEFEAGQFVGLGLEPDAPRSNEATKEHSEPRPDRLIKRAYSIASSSDDQAIEFYVTLVHSGQLTPRMWELKIGDRIWMGKITFQMQTILKVIR